MARDFFRAVQDLLDASLAESGRSKMSASVPGRNIADSGASELTVDGTHQVSVLCAILLSMPSEEAVERLSLFIYSTDFGFCV